MEPEKILNRGNKLTRSVNFSFIGLVLVFMAVWLAACGGQSKEQTPTSPKGTAGTGKDIQITSWQSEQPADILLLIDQSGSMSIGKAPTDPGGLRLQGSRFFLDFVAGRSRTGSPNRFGVVNFGTEAPRQHAIPLTVLTSIDDPAISQVAARFVSLNLGDTSFINALGLSLDFFRQASSFEDKRYRAIVIFTDGEPDDKRRRQMGTKDYFADIQKFYAEKLKPQGVDLFVVGIDTVGKKWSETIPYWKALAGDDHVFTTPTMPALKEQFNRIVQRIWHLPEAGAVMVSSSGPMEVEVEPYLAALEFNLFPSQPGVSLKITRPNGQVVKPGADPDAPAVKKLSTFECLTVVEPAPGRWRLEVVGGAGKVEVLRNPIPLRMHLISPTHLHPQGKPMQVTAEFKRTDGKPVKPHPDYPLGLSAEVVTPAGKRIAIKFPDDKGYDGVFTGEPVVEDTKAEGTYQLVLKVTGGDRYHNQYPVTIQVKPIPYLLVLKPDVTQSVAPADKVDVKAQLLKNGQPLSPSGAFSNHPDYLVMAQIFRQHDEVKGPRVWLGAAKDPEKKGHFAGQVPLPGGKEGEYLLVVKLAPEDKEKEATVDQTLLRFIVKKPPLAWWWWAALAFLLAGTFAGAIFYVRRPKPFSWYYWAENKPVYQIVSFGQKANETFVLLDNSLKATRQGKDKGLRLESSGTAKLLRADGGPTTSLEFSTSGRFMVETDAGERVVVHAEFDQPPNRPESVKSEDPEDPEDFFGGPSKSPPEQSGGSGGDNWGFGPTK